MSLALSGNSPVVDFGQADRIAMACRQQGGIVKTKSTKYSLRSDPVLKSRWVCQENSPVVNLRNAGRLLRVKGVRRDGEDGRGERERDEPRHEARQARLRLGPHDASLCVTGL